MSFDSGKYRIKHWEGRGNTEKAGGARGEGTLRTEPQAAAKPSPSGQSVPRECWIQ